jgi:hypothetical protein
LFPPSFFDQLEDRLNLAVYDTNQDYRMDIPGVLSTSIGHTKRFLHLADRTVEVPLTATADEIRAALQDGKTPSKMPTIAEQVAAIKAKTAKVRERAVSIVAESESTVGLANEELDKAEKINEELRAELAGLNGGEPL